MTIPTYLLPFILEGSASNPVASDGVELYLPDRRPAPVVVLVHGGPLREAPESPPSRWPVFLGYAEQLVSRGCAVAMFDHELLIEPAYRAAANQLSRCIDVARRVPGVDASRVALWAFSGGGPLVAPYLDGSRPWLRAVALSYPLLRLAEPGTQPTKSLTSYDVVEHLSQSGSGPPIVLTVVGDEMDGLVPAQQDLINRAETRKAPLDVIRIEDAPHSFDVLATTAQARAGLLRSLDRVAELLA